MEGHIQNGMQPRCDRPAPLTHQALSHFSSERPGQASAVTSTWSTLSPGTSAMRARRADSTRSVNQRPPRIRLQHLERHIADFHLVHPARMAGHACWMDHFGLIFEPVLVHSARLIDERAVRTILRGRSSPVRPCLHRLPRPSAGVSAIKGPACSMSSASAAAAGMLRPRSHRLRAARRSAALAPQLFPRQIPAQEKRREVRQR